MAKPKNHPSLSSTELGTLWLAYQYKTLTIRTLEHFIEKTIDDDTKDFLQSYYKKLIQHVQDIKEIYNQEGAVIPVGYTEDDVNKEVPKLFDNHFDLMYYRMSAKISIGIYALYSSMSYREDIRELYNDFEKDSLLLYNQTTDLLMKKGILPLPPIIPVPKKIEFAHDKNYMSGFNLFSEKRPLNAIEIAFLYQTLETNITGMHMMTGFAQAAKNDAVRKYFTAGKELSKKIISQISEILMQSDLQPPATWGGSVSDSNISPFSDKLMMYNTSLLSTFGLSGNAIGAAFSLRSDLPLKLFKISQDVFTFAKDGGKIMVKNGWLEEPPQAPNRSDLAKGKE